jgi:hypothetical protein
MNTDTCRKCSTFILTVIACIFLGCDDSNSDSRKHTVTASSDWTCASDENCQDVYDVEFLAGSIVSFSVQNVSMGSVAQMALYGPAVPLGGTNLFTSSTDEFRCTSGSSCDDYTDGERVGGLELIVPGAYRFAVTMDSASCDTWGAYDIKISSNKPFNVTGQTVNDAASLAAGHTCP